eukprot:6487046-Ditylum_brightwellii.AAC.1
MTSEANEHTFGGWRQQQQEFNVLQSSMDCSSKSKNSGDVDIDLDKPDVTKLWDEINGLIKQDLLDAVKSFMPPENEEFETE